MARGIECGEYHVQYPVKKGSGQMKMGHNKGRVDYGAYAHNESARLTSLGGMGRSGGILPMNPWDRYYYLLKGYEAGGIKVKPTPPPGVDPRTLPRDKRPRQGPRPQGPGAPRRRPFFRF